MDQSIQRALDVATRIFVEQRREDGVGKNSLRSRSDDGGTQSRTKGTPVRPVVGLTIECLVVDLPRGFTFWLIVSFAML